MTAAKQEVYIRNVPHKNSLWNSVVEHRVFYLMLLPGILYFLIFHYGPMLGLVIAFKDYSVTKGIWESNWVDLKWFKQIFSTPEFYIVLRNTLIINGYKVIFCFSAPVILALILNEVKNDKFKRTAQTVIYLPHFISWVVIGGIMINLLSQNGGLVNEIIKLFGMKPVYFLGSQKTFRSVLVLSEIWKESGYGTVVYMAAMTNISPDLYEAAIMDGAGRLRRIWHITIPGILPTVIVMFILQFGQLLEMGTEQILVLYNPLVYDVGDVIGTYVFRTGISLGRYSLASAVGMFNSVVGLVLVLFTNKLSKKVSQNSLW